MPTFFEWILIGCGAGIVVLPITMAIRNMIADTLERRMIKREIKKGNFLITIDPKDFDTKAWEKDINPDDYKEKLKNMDEEIFKHKRFVKNQEQK